APEIMLMDEPFGALDPLTAENLRSQVVDLWRDSATGVNTLVVVTHSVEEAVFLAGRIVVFGSNPGHVREELENTLPYPRQERSPEFEDMVDRLHAILTATLLPEPAPATPQRLIPFPRVHVSEVTGLLDHLLTRPGGKGPVFELAEDLGVDYDRMSAVVRAAEQLGWVSTPGEVVQLTQAGREVMAMDDAARKDASRALVGVQRRQNSGLRVGPRQPEPGLEQFRGIDDMVVDQQVDARRIRERVRPELLSQPPASRAQQFPMGVQPQDGRRDVEQRA